MRPIIEEVDSDKECNPGYPSDINRPQPKMRVDQRIYSHAKHLEEYARNLLNNSATYICDRIAYSVHFSTGEVLYEQFYCD